MTYTAATLSQAIGTTVLVRVEHWHVPMLVTDAKTAYGKPRVQVTPLNGTGSAWIDLERIKQPAETTAPAVTPQRRH